MTERALSETAMLAGLRDIHLPAEAPGAGAPDLLAAAGLGLSLALIVALLLQVVTERWSREGPAAPPPAPLTRLEALHRLKARRPDRFAAMRPLLYRRGGRPDLDEVLRELGPDA